MIKTKALGASVATSLSNMARMLRVLNVALTKQRYSMLLSLSEKKRKPKKKLARFQTQLLVK